MNGLLQDIRYAARWLRRAPGFTAMAVICMGIGIGVNATMFSTMYGGMLRPPALREPSRVVVIEDHQRSWKPDQTSGVSYENLSDMAARSKTMTEFTGLWLRSLVLADGDNPERYQGGVIAWSTFRTLGVQPVLGRDFEATDDRPEAPRTVILSHGVWRRRYAGDPGVIGRVVPVNGHAHTIIGVMPERFEFPFFQKIWVPAAHWRADMTRSSRWLVAYARLAPGATLAQARQEAAAISTLLAAEHPDANEGFTTVIKPLRDKMTPIDVRTVLPMMMGATLCLLLVACANVANLLLARSAVRSREIAVRTAIGAGRGRIIRQLLTESLMIAGLGCVLGIGLTFWGLDLFRAAIPADAPLPYYVYWEVDPPTLTFTVAISVLTALVFGLAPALEATRAQLVESLKDGGRGATGGRRSNRLRNGLVVTQVALSVVLLVAGALFMRSFIVLQGATPGFDTSPLMTLRIYMNDEHYPGDRARLRRVNDVVRRIESLPGVESAGASNLIAIRDGGASDRVIPEGRTFERGEEPRINYAGVTPHWLRTLNVTIRRGRDLQDAESEDSVAVAVVTRALTRRLWGADVDPIGRRFRFVSDPAARWLTVVGEVDDFHVNDMDQTEPQATAFVPYLWLSAHNTGITIRVAGDPVSVLEPARREIRAADPQMPVFDAMTMERVRRTSFWEKGLYGITFGVFGALALLLASIGVYGVVSYGVSQRTHEIGVRMALGARAADVVRLVVRQGMGMALAGVLWGTAAALAVTHLARTLLWGVSPFDPVSFIGIAGLLGLVVLAASWVPAMRAARVEPVVALREE